MKGRIAIGAAVILGAAQLGLAQNAAPPQTARQALIEMFLGKTPGTFVKHLPSVTVAALNQTGLPIDQFSGAVAQLQANSQKLETFDTGSTILIAEERQTQRKIEVTVEKDDLRGEEDELQLSFRGSRLGKPDPMPFLPTLTFLMKSEGGIWKLSEVAVTLRMPIGDPEFLKGLTGQLTVSRSAANEASAAAALRTLSTAEITYAVMYPDVGFTCTLADLGGMGKGAVRPHAAQLIDDPLASGNKDGYVFAITGCTGSPASKFRMAAVPATPAAGKRAFCTDESAVIRSSDDGQAGTCLGAGKPLQ